MSVLRYLLVIGVIGGLALITVAEHAERTRIGFALRELETERARLAEEEKTARLAFEQAVVPERLLERAAAIGVSAGRGRGAERPGAAR